MTWVKFENWVLRCTCHHRALQVYAKMEMERNSLVEFTVSTVNNVNNSHEYQHSYTKACPVMTIKNVNIEYYLTLLRDTRPH